MKLFFLGTGPTGGIKAKGREARLESSVLITAAGRNILIDVTRDFSEQAKLINRVDAVLITHAHKDAMGGIKKLDKWLEHKVPVYSLAATLKRIKQVNNLTTKQIKAWQKFYPLRELAVQAFPVHHSIQPGFPTLGFIFGNKLAYVSDTSGWNKKAEALMKRVEVLILDGAMWGKKLVSHLDIKKILPRLCQWQNKKVIFTQIGHTAPRHEILAKAIKKMCRRASPAYDGLRLRF